MEQQLTASTTSTFTERRAPGSTEQAGFERRQFQDGNRSARPEVAEFANAVDEYKMNNRRRFITFEELYDVMTSLGYHR